jgi:hypothetical protein
MPSDPEARLTQAIAEAGDDVLSQMIAAKERAAFERGAEAMRERAADRADRDDKSIGASIRFLPLPQYSEAPRADS